MGSAQPERWNEHDDQSVGFRCQSADFRAVSSVLLIAMACISEDPHGVEISAFVSRCGSISLGLFCFRLPPFPHFCGRVQYALPQSSRQKSLEALSGGRTRYDRFQLCRTRTCFLSSVTDPTREGRTLVDHFAQIRLADSLLPEI
jgi:hypothetical protein